MLNSDDLEFVETHQLTVTTNDIESIPINTGRGKGIAAGDSTMDEYELKGGISTLRLEKENPLTRQERQKWSA